MLRRGLVILVGLLAGACAFVPTPSASGAEPSSTPQPSADPEELATVPWYAAARSWNADEVELPVFHLDAGRLQDPQPTLTVDVPMAFGMELLDIAREPAVAVNAQGTVVYVADDGRRSEVHLTSVGGRPDRVVADMGDLVWAVWLDNQGIAAYLILLAREDGTDLGVWEVSLDGSAAMRRVMPAANQPLGRGDLIPVARVPYLASLRGSPDGRLLARHSCGGFGRPFTCRLDVLERTSGEVMPIADGFERMVGLTDQWVVGVRECGDIACPTEVVDLTTGIITQLPAAIDGLAVSDVEGQPVIASTADIRNGQSHAIEVLWLRDGRKETILRTPADRPVFMLSGLGWAAVMPRGWVEVTFDHPAWQGRFAVRLADGAVLELPEPEINVPPQAVPAGPATQG